MKKNSKKYQKYYDNQQNQNRGFVKTFGTFVVFYFLLKTVFLVSGN